MERKLKVLFLYFGQPRMIKECMPWHDHFINYLQSENIEIDIEYHLWNQYYNKLHLHESRQHKLSYISVDTSEFYNHLTTNRPCNTICNFYSYDIVDNLYEQTNKKISLDHFKNVFAQNISKALACQNISDDYDIVFLLRPDSIFHPDHYSDFANFFKYYNKDEKKEFIYVDWIIYDVKLGLRISDTKLFGRPKTLNLLFKNWEEKMLLYEEKTNKNLIENHHIAINFSSHHQYEDLENIIFNATTFLKKYKFKIVIARPTKEIIEYLKEISDESYNKISKLYGIL